MSGLRKFSSERGVTLVEVVMTIALVAAFAAGVLVIYGTANQSTNIQLAEARLLTAMADIREAFPNTIFRDTNSDFSSNVEASVKNKNTPFGDIAYQPAQSAGTADTLDSFFLQIREIPSEDSCCLLYERLRGNLHIDNLKCLKKSGGDSYALQLRSANKPRSDTRLATSVPRRGNLASGYDSPAVTCS